MLRNDDHQSLALLYHLNSRPWMDPHAPVEESAPNYYADPVEDEPSIGLPSHVAYSSTELLLQRRTSCRQFRKSEMTMDQLGVVLSGAGAVTGRHEQSPGFWVPQRTTPSAGGLYPLECYLVAERISGLDDGLYRYSGITHTLQNIRRGPMLRELGDILLGQHYLDDANFGIVITAHFQRNLKKYGARGYRYQLFEAGHIAQNICLLAEELQLASICLGGFDDAALNNFLSLDGIRHASLYCVGGGFPRVENR